MSFLPQEVIRQKRDGRVLDSAQLKDFVRGVMADEVGDAQIAALCMAILWRGMNLSERTALTCALRDSGDQLAWSALSLNGPVLDKHSTGGVGDKVSLILAPWLAAVGAYVPMISGRGLGHTGGTLDKLSAIPGYSVVPGSTLFKRVVSEVGCAIIGQTARLAPADARFYAVRDVTATVESIDLITASILSKKLAAGLEGLVLDIKVGNGAFFNDLSSAQALAESLVRVANAAGTPTRACLTDMNQVLGSSVGNALEVYESIAFLKGDTRCERLYSVCEALCLEMMAAGHIGENETERRQQLTQALDSGAAAEKFAKMVEALGGPSSLLDKPQQCLKLAPVSVDVPSPQAGYLSALSTRDIGVAVIELGGGRRRAEDAIDTGVGFADVRPLGSWVEKGEPLATVWASDEDHAAQAAHTFIRATSWSAEAPDLPSTLLQKMS